MISSILLKHNLPLIEAISFSIALGIISTYIIRKIIDKYYRPVVATPLSVTLLAIKRVAYIIFPLLYFSIITSWMDLSEVFYFVDVTTKVLLTIAFCSGAIKLLDYIDIWLAHEREKQTNSSHLGLLVTRAYLLKKLSKTTIIVLAVALILLNFPVVKELGKGILISAGVVGGILAFAAQKVFSNLFSGMELILSRPIQVGDTVTIGTETGTIEMIGLNQVRLRTWDLRLVIYPLTYFAENTFQNLSHADQGLIGAVFFYTDYRVDLEVIRKALTETLQSSNLWNKKTNALQVTEMREETIQLRALVSANSNGDLWNLRCYVREKILLLITKEYPEMLPRRRIQLDRISQHFPA